MYRGSGCVLTHLGDQTCFVILLAGEDGSTRDRDPAVSVTRCNVAVNILEFTLEIGIPPYIASLKIIFG